MALIKIGSNGLDTGVGGKVLQIVSTTKTDTFSSSSTGSWVDITGLSLSITPSSTSSKIFISFSVQQGASSNGYANLRLVRDSTDIAIGNSGGGSRLQATTNLRNTLTASQVSWNNEFLDSPASSSALTYKLQVYNDTIGTWYINRSSADTNSSSQGRTVSTITAYEIQG